jgi:hypothetical protein
MNRIRMNMHDAEFESDRCSKKYVHHAPRGAPLGGEAAAAMPPHKKQRQNEAYGCPSGIASAPFGRVPDGPHTQRGQVLESTKQQWRRPDLPPMDAARDDVIFQQVDTDQYYAPLDPRFYPAGTPTDGERPIIRMFGVTGDGNSVTCHVHGFQPYFFVNASNVTRSSVDDGSFAKELDRLVSAKSRGMGQQGKCVEKVEWMMKQTLQNYQKEKAVPFLKVTMVAPHHVSSARRVFEESGQMTYESNVVFPLRFMIDHDLAGGQWAVVKAGHYHIRTKAMKSTACQLEIDIHHERIEAKDPMDGDWGRIAPLRILSFDIECYAKKGGWFLHFLRVCQRSQLTCICDPCCRFPGGA